MAQKSTTEKYLQRYAEPSAEWTAGADAGAFEFYQSALVVPAYRETSERIVAMLSRVHAPTLRLLVVVVNEPTDASEAARRVGQKFIAELKGRSEVSTSLRGSPLTLLRRAPSAGLVCDTLLIDATQPGYCLGEKEGVGRARKMGLDAALSLQRRGIVSSPMLGCSDADAILPSDYFERLEQNHAGASGLLFPYQHVSEGGGASSATMQAVEATFRYYVLGLAHAKSPYAYHSLGSALAIDAEHYAQVRGVPNRQAGEDFHVLAKLSKLAPLKRCAGRPIQLVTRQSTRVPFGTGPTLAKASAEFREHGQLLTYDPEVFEQLRLFLETMSALVESDTHWLSKTERAPVLSAALLEELAREPFVLGEVVATSTRLAARLARCPSAVHRQRRFHESFDALATLQFIHRAEADSRPRVSLEQALKRARFFQGVPEAPLQWLEAAENALPLWVGPAAPAGIVRSGGRMGQLSG